MLESTNSSPRSNGTRSDPAPEPGRVEDAATAQASVTDARGSKAEISAAVSAVPFEWLANAATRVGAITGAFAGAVAFLYLLGGTILWIRFQSAGLPADQAVSLVPRNDLIVVGLRVMVLPALLAGAAFFLLARGERRLSAFQSPRFRRGLSLIGLVGIAGLVLIVPFTPGALAWPVAAFVGWHVWHRWLWSCGEDVSGRSCGEKTSARANAEDPAGHASSEDYSRRSGGEDPSSRKFPLWRAAIVIALLAAAVSVARQFDRPIQLPSVTVQVGEEAKQVGVLVDHSGDEVAVGFGRAHAIRVFARAELTRLVIGPPLDRVAPERSLLSRALGDQSAWAATPLEIWCGGQRYRPWEFSKLCRTEPEVLGVRDRARQRAVAITVRCPDEATDGCSGFLRLMTINPVAVRAVDREARIVVGKSPFQVSAGEKLDVQLQVNSRIRRVLSKLNRQPVPLEAIVSLDLLGDAVIARRDVAMRFHARGTVRGGQRPRDDKPKDDKPKAAAGGQSQSPSGGGQPGNPSNGDVSASGSSGDSSANESDGDGQAETDENVGESSADNQQRPSPAGGNVVQEDPSQTAPAERIDPEAAIDLPPD